MWVLRRAHRCVGKGTNDLFTCTDTDAPIMVRRNFDYFVSGRIFQVKMIMKTLTSFSRDANRVLNNGLVAWCILI